MLGNASVKEQARKRPIETFEIADALHFGFGGLQAYLERTALTGPPPSVLVISLRYLRHIDSVGLRCIAQSLRWSQAHRCRLLVVGLNQEVRRSLETAGLACEFLPEWVLNGGKGVND